MDAYPKEVIIEFLRSEEWVIEEIEAVEDVGTGRAANITVAAAKTISYHIPVIFFRQQQ